MVELKGWARSGPFDTVTVEQLKRVSFSLSYSLRRGDTELAVARSEHAAISMQTNRPTRLPGELVQLLEAQQVKEEVG